MNAMANVSFSTALVLCLVLTGCSSSDDRGGGPSDSSETTERADEPTEVEVENFDTVESLEETSPLEGGPEASSGAMLQSDLTSTNAAATMHDFLLFVLTDVDTYWSGIWAGAGYAEPFVNYAFPIPGERLQVVAGCGSGGSGLTDDATAEYCSGNDYILISQKIALDIWNGVIQTNGDSNDIYNTGDFSVAYVVAHEYAHSLQAELGLLGGSFQTYKTELHADCWAGVWANSAYYKGLLEAGDVEEAFQTALDIGDYGFDDPNHHGTPSQRSAAFMAGYNSGLPVSCDTFLSTAY